MLAKIKKTARKTAETLSSLAVRLDPPPRIAFKRSMPDGAGSRYAAYWIDLISMCKDGITLLWHEEISKHVAPVIALYIDRRLYELQLLAQEALETLPAFTEQPEEQFVLRNGKLEYKIPGTLDCDVKQLEKGVPYVPIANYERFKQEWQVLMIELNNFALASEGFLARAEETLALLGPLFDFRKENSHA